MEKIGKKQMIITINIDVDLSTGKYKIIGFTPNGCVDEESTPQISVLDNKYQLNESAAKFMNVFPDDRLSIKFIQVDDVIMPAIAKEDMWGAGTGNKLTKQLSVSYRGASRTALLEYGEKFILTKHEKEGIFILNTDTPKLSITKSIDSIVEEIVPKTKDEKDIIINDENISFDDDGLPEIDFGDVSIDIDTIDDDVTPRSYELSDIEFN